MESLGGGVSPDEGITIGGLPRVPRSLSWVRIAQRFPVRIKIQASPPGLMRLGASAVHRDRSVSAAQGAAIRPPVDEGELHGGLAALVANCSPGPAASRTRCAWWRSWS